MFINNPETPTIEYFKNSVKDSLLNIKRTRKSRIKKLVMLNKKNENNPQIQT